MKYIKWMKSCTHTHTHTHTDRHIGRALTYTIRYVDNSLVPLAVSAFHRPFSFLAVGKHTARLAQECS